MRLHICGFFLPTLYVVIVSTFNRSSLFMKHIFTFTINILWQFTFYEKREFMDITAGKFALAMSLWFWECRYIKCNEPLQTTFNNSFLSYTFFLHSISEISFKVCNPRWKITDSWLEWCKLTCTEEGNVKFFNLLDEECTWIIN